MYKSLLFQILILSVLTSACISPSTDRVIPTASPTILVQNTNTPTIEETPTSLPTASITPAVIAKLGLHALALNEANIRKIENLATFGMPSKYCIHSNPDSALGTRVVNGQIEYLLAITDFESKNIQIWNLETEKNVRTLISNNFDSVDSVLFALDQRTLISFFYYETGTLSLWDIESGNQQQKFVLKPNYSYDDHLSISQDGLRIALFSAPYINNVEIFKVSEFNIQTNQISDTSYDFPLYSETPPPHIYTSNGSLVALTYDFDNRLHFLDLTNQQDTILQFPFSNLNEVGLAEAIFSTLAVSSNEKYIVGGALNGDIYLWNTVDGTLLNVFKAHTTQRSDGWLGAIKNLEFSPESNLLLSVGYDGFTKLWDINSRVLLKELDSCYHFGGFTEDGRYLVTVGEKGIELWGIP